MKAVAYYDLPMGEGEQSLQAIVEKARERGLPLLAVVFEVTDDEVARSSGIDGLTIEQEAAMQLGALIAEVTHELNTLGPVRLRKISARVLTEDDELQAA